MHRVHMWEWIFLTPWYAAILGFHANHPFSAGRIFYILFNDTSFCPVWYVCHPLQTVRPHFSFNFPQS